MAWFARIGNSSDSCESAWRTIKIRVSIANDSRESIRANRVALHFLKCSGPFFQSVKSSLSYLNSCRAVRGTPWSTPGYSNPLTLTQVSFETSFQLETLTLTIFKNDCFLNLRSLVATRKVVQSAPPQITDRTFVISAIHQVMNCRLWPNFWLAECLQYLPTSSLPTEGGSGSCSGNSLPTFISVILPELTVIASAYHVKNTRLSASLSEGSQMPQMPVELMRQRIAIWSCEIHYSKRSLPYICLTCQDRVPCNKSVVVSAGKWSMPVSSLCSVLVIYAERQ